MLTRAGAPPCPLLCVNRHRSAAASLCAYVRDDETWAFLPPAKSHPSGYVVLDRVDDLAEADTLYCIHGRATCASCAHWCWLGSETHDEVTSGRAAPICMRCARKYEPPPFTRLDDHLRTDGPHT